MLNLYMPVYENIENEVIDITRTIHFCDEQLDTYSTRLSDLLFRCCVEIESISKELFNAQFSVGDKIKIGKKKNIECELEQDMEWRKKNKKGVSVLQNLYFDYNCLDYLSEKWNIGDRKVLINASNMFFKQEANIVLFPLSTEELTSSHSDKDRGGWLKAYQSVKHSRIKNQNLGSVFYMLHALSALYILNIYYKYNKNIQVHLTNLMNDTPDFDLSCGSKIFTTTKGHTIEDLFIPQYDGTLELNVNQKISYVKWDSNNIPIFAGSKKVTFSDGSVGEVDIPFEREQDGKIS